MLSLQSIKKKMDELELLAEEIRELGIQLLEGVDFSPARGSEDDYFVGNFEQVDYRSPLKKVQSEVKKKYQQWYAVSSYLIKEYSSHTYDSFTFQHSYVCDMLSLNYPTDARDKTHVINKFLDKFEEQTVIISSLPAILEVKEQGIRRLITADIARSEMEQAEILLASGFHRAAGSIAGVALELHLKTLCDVDGIPYRVKATMSDFIQALKGVGKLDTTEFKQLEYLASIRNKCSHPSDVPVKDVQILIREVNKLI